MLIGIVGGVLYTMSLRSSTLNFGSMRIQFELIFMYGGLISGAVVLIMIGNLFRLCIIFILAHAVCYKPSLGARASNLFERVKN